MVKKMKGKMDFASWFKEGKKGTRYMSNSMTLTLENGDRITVRRFPLFRNNKRSERAPDLSLRNFEVEVFVERKNNATYNGITIEDVEESSENIIIEENEEFFGR